jgi:hypothetical protein
MRYGTLPSFGLHNLRSFYACVAYVSTYLVHYECVENIVLRRAHGNQEQQSGTRSADRERSRRGSGTEAESGAAWRRW